MSAEAWSQVAEAWEANADGIAHTSGVVAEALLARAALAPGERVLELASGTGHLALELLARVGPTGSVDATDLSPAMVAHIARRLADAPNATTRVVDATDIPAPAGEYDAVVCLMGLMFVPEPTRALQEVRRVLRPGGRLVAATWGEMGRNPWMAAVGFATMANGLISGPAPHEPGGPFSLGDPGQLEKLARDAGFSDVHVETLDYVRHYSSPAEHFDLVRVLAPPLAAALATATSEQMLAVRRTADEFVAGYRDSEGGLDLPACAVLLTAS